MELRNFCFAYKNEPETLHIHESKIPANRIVGIIGNNGAGKSTSPGAFCGLEKRCGEVIWNGRTYRPKDRLNTCYMVMQEVNHQLFTETVLDEVLISMEDENRGVGRKNSCRVRFNRFQRQTPYVPLRRPKAACSDCLSNRFQALYFIF